MNRGIYLNVFSPESNEKDMIDTAFEISKNYSKSFITEEKYEKLLKYLSKAVYKYKKGLLDSKDPNRYFHGTRDFYHLIKSVVRNILNKKECYLINESFFSISVIFVINKIAFVFFISILVIFNPFTIS